MPDITLSTFIAANRDELIGRCREKVSKRASPPPSDDEIAHGVPLFLHQLCRELAGGRSNGDEISTGALHHGRDLQLRGFTVGQVVHDYGDVCQSITDLAVEMKAAISTEEFRTLNRCLDDAIAGAVTEFARDQDSRRDGDLSELWSLVNSASAAFDALQSGKVGVAGSTGALVGRSLAALRAYVDRQEVTATRAASTAVGVAVDRPSGPATTSPK